MDHSRDPRPLSPPRVQLPPCPLSCLQVAFQLRLSQWHCVVVLNQVLPCYVARVVKPVLKKWHVAAPNVHVARKCGGKKVVLAKWMLHIALKQYCYPMDALEISLARGCPLSLNLILGITSSRINIPFSLPDSVQLRLSQLRCVVVLDWVLQCYLDIRCLKLISAGCCGTATGSCSFSSKTSPSPRALDPRFVHCPVNCLQVMFSTWMPLRSRARLGFHRYVEE